MSSRSFLLARSLGKRRSFTVGVLVPELNDGYHTMVLNGIGDHQTQTLRGAIQTKRRNAS